MSSNERIEGVEMVYLAGPMSGHLDYNFPMFNAWAARLRERGYVVMNPAETAGGASHLKREWYFRYDFAVISNVDAVFLIPGWEQSPGAKAEVVYAHELGLPIYELRIGTNVEWYLCKTEVRGVSVRHSPLGHLTKETGF